MTQPEILDRLNRIYDPCSVASGYALGLNDMGLVESVSLDPAGTVTVNIRLTSPGCLMIGYFVTEIRRSLSEMDEVTNVIVKHDIGENWEPEMMAPAALAQRRKRLAEMEERASLMRSLSAGSSRASSLEPSHT